MRAAGRILLLLPLLLVACQVRNMRFLSPSTDTVTLAQVRQNLGMDAYDSVVESHRILVRGHYEGADGNGTFQRTYEPDGRFYHHSEPARAGESIERYDGDVLWVEASGAPSYPMTLTRTQLACSVEWILSGRWLAKAGSPFQSRFDRSVSKQGEPGFELQLLEGGPETSISLDPLALHPKELVIEGRTDSLHMELQDWRTRRGFAWPYTIRIRNKGRAPTILTTTEITFEPSELALQETATREAHLEGVSFVPLASRAIPLKRSASGHLLARPSLMGKEVGWFLIDTGTGVNCLDHQTIKALPDFLSSNPKDSRSISVVGLGGRVESRVVQGREFALGPLRIEHMEWVTLDLTGLQEIVGIPLAGVLGGDFFERAVVDLDLADGTLILHDPRTFDASLLPWRPLRFDGTTPCVEASFDPDHSGWFRLDTGSDDTITFHAPWVRKLRLVDKATQLIPMRLKGIGGEISAVRGRIRWFELLGQRFQKPMVTMVERATGPLANPDLYGNIGVGFFHGQRLVLDFHHHRIALIPR
ncbi:MAG: retropepsin-like domain-containing protein [Planctomycetes bacterium]|nr:retropepsin-like domain-containing protein [Planctomycetota bacterium]